ncbi:MAG: hypothetical protein JWQ40_4147 [Segetibacter sp.]|jgi:hypothetical protein|nr:hypothetical protein [Segetibacter sp.]
MQNDKHPNKAEKDEHFTGMHLSEMANVLGKPGDEEDIVNEQEQNEIVNEEEEGQTTNN